MSRDWVILLEAAAPDGDPPLELAALEALLGVLVECLPTALYAPDRYALQLTVAADDPAEALDLAMARWRTAARRAEVPRWRLVRVEVKTPAELAAEHQAEQRATSTPASDGRTLEAAYRATRAFLSANEPGEVVGALAILVHELGGVVMPAASRHPDAIPVDLSLGHGQPVVAVVERFSVSRLQLEEVLPVVLEDARAVIHDLRRQELRAVPAP